MSDNLANELGVVDQTVQEATLTISDVILSTNDNAVGAIDTFIDTLISAPNGSNGVTPDNATIVRASADYADVFIVFSHLTSIVS